MLANYHRRSTVTVHRRVSQLIIPPQYVAIECHASGPLMTKMHKQMLAIVVGRWTGMGILLMNFCGRGSSLNEERNALSEFSSDSVNRQQAQLTNRSAWLFPSRQFLPPGCW